VCNVSHESKDCSESSAGDGFTIAIVSTGGPELFVICKNCGSEVSPYITECPYCGNRLRKRAPKLDRQGRIAERLSRRPPAPSLTRLRRGEIPGIRHETHAYATIVLVLLGVVGCLIWRTTLIDLTKLVVFGPIGNDWWRPFTAPFIYTNTGYAFVTLSAVALFGTLLERRVGPVLVIALFLLGAVGGIALAAQVSTSSVILGANGGALALLCAWAVPDLIRLRHGNEFGGDLIGTLVFAVVIVLMPIATTDAAWIPAGVGIIAGLALGFPLARVHHV
jgi:membrane associated rhomboid family serine protease